MKTGLSVLLTTAIVSLGAALSTAHAEYYFLCATSVAHVLGPGPPNRSLAASPAGRRVPLA